MKATRLSASWPMSDRKKTGTRSEPKQRRLVPRKWLSKICVASLLSSYVSGQFSVMLSMKDGICLAHP